MGESQFALYEAIAFGLGILIEIPSGAFADLLGRRKTVILAFGMQAIGSIIFTLGYLGNAYFFIGNVLIIVAFAFKSGSLEALVYDTLLQKNKVEHYDDIIGKAKSLHPLSIAIASIIGGVAWKYSIYAPWALTSLVFVFGFLAAFKLVEPKIDTDVFSWKRFLLQSKRGFGYLFVSEFRKYTLSFFVMSGAYIMWHTGIIRVLMGRDFGYNGESLNYLIGATFLISFLASYYFSAFRRKLGDLKGFMSLLALSGVAWLATGITGESLAIGFMVFMILTTAGTLSESWISVILNKHVKSKDRATAISTLSLIVQIPYVFIVVLYGNLIESGTAAIFYFITAFLYLIAIISYHRAEKAHVLVKKTPKL